MGCAEVLIADLDGRAIPFRGTEGRVVADDQQREPTVREIGRKGGQARRKRSSSRVEEER
jgi:hypothetical protein